MAPESSPWERAVQLLKTDPARQELAAACYYDEPLEGAARRFAASDEWQAVLTELQAWLPGRALDLGAGHGIASYGLARAGCRVIALEPDPGQVVGTQAIRRLSQKTGLAIRIVRGQGECLPFAHNVFDIVYGRQVLHHAADLERFCREAARVLRPGGVLLASREHVISRPEDLGAFLADHPLQDVSGGENAFLLEQYSQALRNAGLSIKKVYGPYDTPMNYYPMTRQQVTRSLAARFSWLGKARSARLAAAPGLQRLWGRYHSWRDRTPGRLYSFVAIK